MPSPRRVSDTDRNQVQDAEGATRERTKVVKEEGEEKFSCSIGFRQLKSFPNKKLPTALLSSS